MVSFNRGVFFYLCYYELRIVFEEYENIFDLVLKIFLVYDFRGFLVVFLF